jgi:hypothetical protein
MRFTSLLDLPAALVLIHFSKRQHEWELNEVPNFTGILS